MVDISSVDFSDPELITGDHQIMVIDSLLSEGPKGPYIKWTFRVRETEFKPTMMTSLGHLFGIRIMKNIIQSCGYESPAEIKDTKELHNKKLIGTFIIKKDYKGNDASTILNFKPYGADVPVEDSPFDSPPEKKGILHITPENEDIPF